MTVRSGTATIRVSSSDFDPYVYGLATGGLKMVLAENDDESGGGLASQIQLAAGVYVIEVTSYDVKARGAFLLQITGNAVIAP